MKNQIVLMSLLLTFSLQSTTVAIMTQTDEDHTRNLNETAHLITHQMQQLFAAIIALLQQGAPLEKIEDAVEETTAEVLEEVAAEIVEEALEETIHESSEKTDSPTNQVQTTATTANTTAELQNNVTTLLKETQQKLSALVPGADSKTLEDISHQLLAMLETVKTVPVRKPLRAIDFAAWNQLLENEESTRQPEEDADNSEETTEE